MKRRALMLCAALIGATISPAHRSHAQTSMPESTVTEIAMTARGTFTVQVHPQSAESGGGSFSRLFLDKEFHGDLTGTGHGTMVATETAVEGSRGYVALERVTGTLNGRRGSFILQHVGYMSRQGMTLTITVLPDSGTDELVGLSGRFVITIADGKHSYAFDYTLRN